MAFCHVHFGGTMRLHFIIYSLILLFSFGAFAHGGGINLNKTRVIYNSDRNSESIKVNNTSKKEQWLIRTWITEYQSNKKTNKFVITPPLYRIQEEESIQLRIDEMANSFPQDRESIFHINVLAIPEKNDNEQSSLQFAINHRVKLIYRPAILNKRFNIEDAYSNLKIRKSTGGVIVENQSPYYITMDKVRVNGKDVKSMSDFMVAPFNKMIIPEKNASELSYVIINDYGGTSSEIKLSL